MALSLEKLRKMSTTELNKVKKDDIIASVLATASGGQPSISNSDIFEEIKKLRKDFDDKTDGLKSSIDNVLLDNQKLNKEVKTLKKTVQSQKEVLINQQVAIEQLFARERALNFIVNGVAENPNLPDQEFILRMCAVLGIQNVPTVFQRIGKNTVGPKPIFVTCNDSTQRKEFIDNSKKLKAAGSITYDDEQSIEWNKIYIRKDVHPSIRKEWGRLRAVTKTEKEKPENVGCDITFDNTKREVLRDGIVIDSWKASFL